jgi:hypothetical protein
LLSQLVALVLGRQGKVLEALTPGLSVPVPAAAAIVLHLWGHTPRGLVMVVVVVVLLLTALAVLVLAAAGAAAAARPCGRS